MAFPEFDSGKRKILFFSRGRGRGHAIPDIQLVKELQEGREDIQVRFASYGTGARTIEEHGQPLIDLDLPDLNGISETTVLAGKLIGWLDPDLVVAHEEFPALPAAKIFDKPTVLITDWFTAPERYSMLSLQFADEILFIDEPGIFEEPAWVQGKVRYVAPILRPFAYTRDDRARAREELAIPGDATVIAVLPGSWTEEKAPIHDLVMPAYDQLDAAEKRLIWVAGQDHEALRKQTGGRAGVRIIESDWTIERLMVASDLAITKATRKTARELDFLGIPSIAISHGNNPIDEKRVGLFPLCQMVRAEETTPELLAGRISEALAAPPVRAAPQSRSGGAAKELANILDAVCKPDGGGPPDRQHSM